MTLDVFFVLMVSALAGMGVGGGGLPVLYFTALRELPQREAQGLNILLFISASASAFIINRKKRVLDVKSIIIIAASGCVFAVFGALLAQMISPSLLRKIFGGLLILTGLTSVLKKDPQ